MATTEKHHHRLWVLAILLGFSNNSCFVFRVEHRHRVLYYRGPIEEWLANQAGRKRFISFLVGFSFHSGVVMLKSSDERDAQAAVSFVEEFDVMRRLSRREQHLKNAGELVLALPKSCAQLPHAVSWKQDQPASVLRRRLMDLDGVTEEYQLDLARGRNMPLGLTEAKRRSVGPLVFPRGESLVHHINV